LSQSRNNAYIKRSTIAIRSGMLDGNLSQIIQLFNNFAEIYYPLFLNFPELNKKVVKTKTFLTIISEKRRNKITKHKLKEIYGSDKLYFNLIAEINYFYNQLLFLINTFEFTSKHYFNLFNNYVNYKSRIYYLQDIHTDVIPPEIKSKIYVLQKNSMINIKQKNNGKYYILNDYISKSIIMDREIIKLLNVVGYPLKINFNKLHYIKLSLKLNPKLDYFYYNKIGYYSNVFNKDNYETIIRSELKNYNLKSDF